MLLASVLLFAATLVAAALVVEEPVTVADNNKALPRLMRHEVEAKPHGVSAAPLDERKVLSDSTIKSDASRESAVGSASGLESGAVGGAAATAARHSSSQGSATERTAYLLASGQVPPGGHSIMITTRDKAAERAAYMRQHLSPLGVEVDVLTATEANASQKELQSACAFEKYPGALNPGIQAIAASHKRAMERALQREENWTLIFEDDIELLPVPTSQWLEAFTKAWGRLKYRDVAVLRLGWCAFSKTLPFAEDLGGGFELWSRQKPADRHDPEAPHGINNGMCTTASIFHKEYLKQIIDEFPGCHEPVDLFFAHKFYNQPPFSNKVYAITHKDSAEMFKGWAPFTQMGMVAQKHAGWNQSGAHSDNA